MLDVRITIICFFNDQSFNLYLVGVILARFLSRSKSIDEFFCLLISPLENYIYSRGLERRGLRKRLLSGLSPQSRFHQRLPTIQPKAMNGSSYRSLHACW